MPADCRGKGRIKWAARTKSVFFGLRGIAALKVNSLSTGADFHRCGRFIYTIFVCISPWQGPQPTGRHDDGGQATRGASRKTNRTCLAFNRRQHTVWTVCQEGCPVCVAVGITFGILSLLLKKSNKRLIIFSKLFRGSQYSKISCSNITFQNLLSSIELKYFRKLPGWNPRDKTEPKQKLKMFSLKPKCSSAPPRC